MDALTQSQLPLIRLGRRPLCVLLSAYACEPDKGSEPGVGWQWTLHLAQAGHQVRVITRANNRPAIEAACGQYAGLDVQFYYYDLPAWTRAWKRGGRGVHLYYLLWQWGAYRRARRLTREQTFDVVHHITFGVFRQPSFMGRLGIPFVFGPVGGGEAAPKALRRGLPWRGRLLDALRDAVNWLVRLDPVMRSVFRRADVTLCKTPATLRCIPAGFRSKCRVQLELGMPARTLPPPARPAAAEFKLLFVGRLLYLKGLHLALAAFAHAFADGRARLTLIGSGRDEPWARAAARRLGIDGRLEWIPWLPREQLLARYPQYDVLLFPSLHDSSGNAVLEAMAAGLPIVCLDLGGPGVLVDQRCGIAVPPGPPEVVTVALSRAVRRLADDPPLRAAMARHAMNRACRHFSWTNQVLRMEHVYYEALAMNRGGL